MPTEMKRAYPAVILSVVAVTIAGPLMKLALRYGASPAAIAFYRMVGAGLFCFLLSFRRKQGAPKPKPIEKRDLLLTALGGALLAAHYLVWIPSLEMTSTFASVLLTCTQPIFSITGAYFLFHERTSRNALIALGVSVAGIAVIALSDLASFSASPTALIGDGLALIGAFFVAMFFLCGRTVRKRVDTMRYLGIVYLCAAIVIAVYVLSRRISLVIADGRVWLCLAGIVFICTLLGHGLMNWALKYVRAGIVAMALLGEPLGAAVWAALLFGERVTLPTLVGGLIVIAGVVLFSLATAKDEANAARKRPARAA